MEKFQESETVEFKERWTDRALEDIAAFANTRGGIVFIGVRNDGTVVGTDTSDQEIQRIANTIVSTLKITPSIDVETLKGKDVIVIRVAPIKGVLPYKGRYFTRVGTTNRDMPPEELARRLLIRSGQSWDSLVSPWGKEETDEELLARFTELAKTRLPWIPSSSSEHILQNLGLLREGKLTNAGVLLFTRKPQALYPQAQLRIGIFKGSQILDSHEFPGSLWDQLDGAMARFRQILKVRFDIQVEKPSLGGLQRKETWEYPLEALREAVINALIHRDYTITGEIQVRLYEDRLVISNPGRLPEGITPEQLREPEHLSIPRNPLLAQVFYYAGLIEKWGTGTTRIIELCRAQNLPDPKFEELSNAFKVIFFKDPYSYPRLKELGLTERQIKIMQFLCEKGEVRLKELKDIFPNLSDKTIQRELITLTEKGLLEAIGEKKGRRYRLVR